MVGENKMENLMGNYTGPYWSDGKFQSSVEFGESEPLNDLDELSRLHDTAYAHFKDRRHREAADNWYGREAKKLDGKNAAFAGNAVQYGNYIGKQVSNLLPLFGTNLKAVYGAAGFVIDNISDTWDRINGTYLESEMKDVLDLFETDPQRRYHKLKSKSSKEPAQSSTILYESVENRKFSPVVDVRGTSDGTTFTAPVPQHRMSSEEVAESRAGTDYFNLPNGKRLKKKKRKAAKKQDHEIQTQKASPKLPNLVKKAIYRDYAERQPNLAGPHFDITWNVNPLKMKRKKNKVLPSL